MTPPPVQASDFRTVPQGGPEPFQLPEGHALTIVGWNDTYENKNTRKLARISYANLPAGNSSNGYLSLIAESGPAGAIAFAYHIALCQLHSTQPQRDLRLAGRLVDSKGRILSLERIANLLRIPPDQHPAFLRALTLLASEAVGWITSEPVDDQAPPDTAPRPALDPPPTCPDPAPAPPPTRPKPPGGGEGIGGDRKGGEGSTADPPPPPNSSARDPDSELEDTLVQRNLCRAYPEATVALDPRERHALQDALPLLREWGEDDWRALATWNTCPERIRGRDLWPRDRLELLRNVGEVTPRLRKWWRDTGRRYRPKK